MIHIMKKAALMLAFLAFFANYQGFAGGRKQPDPPQSSASAETNELLRGIDKKITDMNKEITDTNNKIDNTNKEITNTKGEIGKIYAEIDKLKEINLPYNQGNSYMKDDSPAVANPADGDKIPVTPKIVEFLLEKDGKADDLKFYLSKPFTLKIQEQNETKGIMMNESKNMIILLDPANPINETPVEFTKDNEGILIEIPGPDKGNELRILFQKENRTLVFRRDRPRDGYILFSVIINDKNPYRIEHSEVIQLLVAGKDNRQVEVKAAAIDFERPAPKPQAPQYQIYQTSQNINAGYGADGYTPFMPSRHIIGMGSLRPEGVIKSVEKMKRSSLTKNDIEIINEYFKEAEFEGVNADIAIAQMLHVTESFRNMRALSTRNYAGLSNVPPKFTGGFSNMAEGVRAHIQHLKAYAKETPRRPIVDPRYKFAYDRGFSGMNFDQLYRLWSERPQYGTSIDNILRGLYEY